MMRQVLTRRFTRLAKEAENEADAEAFPSKPDLVLIDAGGDSSTWRAKRSRRRA